MLITTKIGHYTVREIQSYLQNNIEGYKLREIKLNSFRLFKGSYSILDEEGLAYEWDNLKDAYEYISEYIMNETDPEYLQKVINKKIDRNKIKSIENQINDIKQERERLDLMISGLIKELNIAKKGE